MFRSSRRVAPGKRSPLKARPFRAPGQSIQDRLEDLIAERVYTWIFVGITAWVLAVMDLWRWYFGIPLLPGATFLIAVVVTGLGAWRIWDMMEEVRRLKQGRDGERVVGQYLD